MIFAVRLAFGQLFECVILLLTPQMACVCFPFFFWGGVVAVVTRVSLQACVRSFKITPA